MNRGAGTGALIRQGEESRAGALREGASAGTLREESRAGMMREGASGALSEKHQLAFLATVIFSVLLYLRPHEVYPGIFGVIPFAKIVALVAIGAYFISKTQLGERMSIWPLELKMIYFLLFLGLLFTPFAASPGVSLETLNDPFLKVVVIFFLMINLIDSRKRLRMIMSWSSTLRSSLGAACYQELSIRRICSEGHADHGIGQRPIWQS